MAKLDKVSIIAGVEVLVVLFGYLGLQKMHKVPPDTMPEIKVGGLLSLTGNFATYGEDMRNALELAAKDIERNEKIKIDLVVEDATSDPTTAVQGASKLINIDKIPLVF